MTDMSSIAEQLFRDAAVAAGYETVRADAERHNDIQDEALQHGMAVLIGLPDGQARLELMLVDAHPWIRYYAAGVLLRAKRAEAKARAALVELAATNGLVAMKSEVALSAIETWRH